MPRFQAIRAFYGELWLLEWNEIVVYYYRLHHPDGIKERSSPFPTISNHLNYNQAKFESDAGNLVWAMGVGKEQICHFYHMR